MSGERGAQEGYLVVADISGYTAFLVETELEHAHAIVHELTTLVRERLVPPMRFVKLEGDAVLCYADGAAFGDGERLAELLEACYFDFSNRLLDMARATTCRCAACATMGSLDLKFVAHFGAFVVQRDAGVDDLAGADVILIHRLLKNSITERMGYSAYVFFTDDCLQHMPASLELPRHAETYELFGETTGGVHDLEPVLHQMREERYEYIGSADADIELTLHIPAPPPVVWGYLVDPVARLRWACRWGDSNPDKSEVNDDGRVGTGAKSHCNHGPGMVSSREYIDWRPFSYFTCHTTTQVKGGFISSRAVTETFEFVAQDGGTLVHYRMRLINRSRLSMLLFQPVALLYRGSWAQWRTNLLSVLEEDRAVLDAIEHSDADAVMPFSRVEGTVSAP